MNTPPFPRHNHRQKQRMSVQFSGTAQLHIFERYDDNGSSIAPQELWYTSEEYDRMALATRGAAIAWQRQRAMVDVPMRNSAGTQHENEDAPSPSQAEAEGRSGYFDSDCIGIEHLLSRAAMLEARTCRVRCVQAVLEEQARQMQMAEQFPSVSLRRGSRWDAIALSSWAQTRRTMLRAQMLGNLHRKSI